MRVIKLNKNSKCELKHNSMELTAIGAIMEIAPDGSPIFIYKTGIKVEKLEDSNVTCLLLPSSDLSAKSICMINIGVVDNSEEIVCKFKLTTVSVPNLYKEGEVIGRLVLVSTASPIVVEDAEEGDKKEDVAIHVIETETEKLIKK